MTIVVKRRVKESPIAPALRDATFIARQKLGDDWKKIGQEERRKDSAAIRRWAKGNGLSLRHHRKEWVLDIVNEKVALPPGHYAKMNGTLHLIIATKVARPRTTR